MRRTKIVCTVGPACEDTDKLKQLVEAGADVFRLNFSHGTPDQHRARVERIRQVELETGKPLGILQDLPGPKIRIGTFQHGPVTLVVGEHFILTTDPGVGDKHRVSVNYPLLANEILPGQHLLLADGGIELRIDVVEPPEIRCTVLLGGLLSNQKGVSAPRAALSVSAFTDKDRALLIKGIEMGVSMAALSFVRSSQDILAARAYLAENGASLPLMAKIEKPEAVDNLDDILRNVDSIMVARGDLGVEIPFADVPLVQKDIIRKALIAAKPVITATQMLRSMVESPRPTRAEATDVANAVLDGSDAVMLSEESAVGAYPVEAVRALAMIAERAETRLFQERAFIDMPPRDQSDISSAIGHAACVLARDAGAKAIVCCTRGGYTARLVARHRPSIQIIAISPNIETIRQMTLVWGVKPELAEEFHTTEGMTKNALAAARRAGLAPGDRIVIAGGSPTAGPGHTDFLRVAITP